jgi:hypothetical protein
MVKNNKHTNISSNELLTDHIFLATTTTTNTSGNTLFYTDIMSNKQFLGFFSATYIFNHDNSHFLGMYLFIFISHKVYSVIVMVNKRQYLLRLWATPGGLLLSVKTVFS